jgi:ABC-type branched-subunit amino acid transport system substrate-binding protein
MKMNTCARARRSVPALIAVVGLVVVSWGLPASAATTGVPLSTFSAPSPSQPGVTPTSVTIGTDQPLTGVSAVGYGEIGPATRAFFDYVNAQGGVFGRAINYIVLDDASDPPTAAADENQLVTSDNVFAYLNGFGNIEHAAIVDSLNAQGVPDLFVGSSCECWNQPLQHPDTFGFGTDYPDEGRLLGSYVARSFPFAKVAYIWENSPVGCCLQSVQELNEEIPPSQVVTRQSFTLADLPADKLLPQVEAAQQARAQVVVLDTLVPAAIALVLLDAASIGYHPIFLDTFRLSADPVTVGRLLGQFSAGKATPALENGLITQDYLPSASDSANPWIQLFRQIHDTYEPRAPFDNMTVYGMAAAYTFTRALAAAGPQPTRQSIVAAVNFGAVDFGGPGLLPLTYWPLNHDGYGGEEIGVVQDGGIQLGGPVYVTHGNGPVIAIPPVTFEPSLILNHSDVVTLPIPRS